MMVARKCSKIFEAFREKTHQPRILCTSKLSLKSDGEIDFLRQTKIEEICSQYTCTARNVKINSLEKRKLTRIRNSDLHKERESIRKTSEKNFYFSSY